MTGVTEGASVYVGNLLSNGALLNKVVSGVDVTSEMVQHDVANDVPLRNLSGEIVYSVVDVAPIVAS